MSGKSDVVSSFRLMLREAFLKLLEPPLDFKTTRQVIAIHVRKGDVTSVEYHPEEYAKTANEVSAHINSLMQSPSSMLQFDQTLTRLLSEHSWGQSAVSQTSLIEVIAQARQLFPDLPIEIVTHKSDPELKELERDPKIKIYAGELEIASLHRLASAKCMFIANSYMGFLAGMLSSSSKIYYPQNAMYSVFGLGTKLDKSGWKCIELKSARSKSPQVSYTRSRNSSLDNNPRGSSRDSKLQIKSKRTKDTEKNLADLTNQFQELDVNERGRGARGKTDLKPGR